MDLLTAVSQVGFPVFCCYLLIKQIITRLDNITLALENLQTTLLFISTEKEQIKGNGRKARLKRRMIK